jgi:PKD repeat protein
MSLNARGLIITLLCLMFLPCNSMAASLVINKNGLSYTPTSGDNVSRNSSFEGGVELGAWFDTTTNCTYQFNLPPANDGACVLSRMVVKVYGKRTGSISGLSHLYVGSDAQNRASFVGSSEGWYQVGDFSNATARSLLVSAGDGLGTTLDVVLKATDTWDGYDVQTIRVECTYDNVDQNVLNKFMGAYTAYLLIKQYKSIHQYFWSSDNWSNQILNDGFRWAFDQLPGWQDLLDEWLNYTPLTVFLQIQTLAGSSEIYTLLDNAVGYAMWYLDYSGPDPSLVANRCDSACAALSNLASSWGNVLRNPGTSDAAPILSSINSSLAEMDNLQAFLQNSAQGLNRCWVQPNYGSGETNAAMALLKSMSHLMFYESFVTNEVYGSPIADDTKSLLIRMRQTIANQQNSIVSTVVGVSPQGKGLQIQVDATSYTESHAFTWLNGMPHTIAAPSPQTGNDDSSYTFLSWSDRGVWQHQITPQADSQYVAVYSPPAISLGMKAVADAVLRQWAPSTPYGNNDIMAVQKSTDGMTDESCIRFNYTAIPQGSTLTYAQLDLVLQTGGAVRDTGVSLQMHDGATWSESAVTWNNYSSSASTTIGTVNGPTNAPCLWHWTSDNFPVLLTKLQDWVNNPSDWQSKNFYITGLNVNGYRNFYTHHNASDSVKPTLIINYIPPPTGTMTVSLYPPEVRTAGARWKLTKTGYDSGWQSHGSVIPDLTTGAYTLGFKSVSGWETPGSRSITITSGPNSDTDTYGFGVQPPTGVSASDGVYTNRIRVTWNSSAGATKYEVWRNTSDDQGGASQIVDQVTGTSYDDYGGNTGLPYFYWIKAKNSAGTTDFSLGDSGYVPTPIHYVALASPNPQAPYISWDTAAHDIQSAVDAAIDGDTVQVGPGSYTAGERGRYNSGYSRLVIDKEITVVGIDGPAETLIVGQPNIRCAYVGDNAVLSGCTLTNGSNNWKGGGADIADSALISNCVVVGNRSDFGGGVYGHGTIVGSEIINNDSSYYGGGVLLSMISNCVVAGNSADEMGGGIADGSAIDSLISNNIAKNSYGGGAYDSSLLRCRVQSNRSGGSGGGVYGGVISNCFVIGNLALDGGGAGVSQAECRNSVISLNTSVFDGDGGVYGGVTHNCSILANSAFRGAGGIENPDLLENCIIYYNHGYYEYDVNSWDNAVFNNCAGWIDYLQGDNNFTNAPRLSSVTWPTLMSDSPCIGAGLNRDWMTDAHDFEGEPRMAGTVDVGADEFHSASGTVKAAIDVDYPHATPGIKLRFVSTATGHIDGMQWDIGDGTVLNDQPVIYHTYATTGLYAVCLSVSNAFAAHTATTMVSVVDAPLFVSPEGNDAADGTSWGTPKRTLQAAVDAAPAGGTIWAGPGIYAEGGRPLVAITNRVLIEKPLKLFSRDGPASTLIVGVSDPSTTNGAQAVRCVMGVLRESWWLSAGYNIILGGFTITNGHTGTSRDSNGGGVCGNYYGVTISNCIVTACSAGHEGGGIWGAVVYASTIKDCSAARGGGICESFMSSSAIIGNHAEETGGGAYRAQRLNDCTVLDNEAGESGGGVSGWEASRSIILYNRSPVRPNWEDLSADYSDNVVSWPLLTGVGNSTNDPHLAGVNNPHLLPLSPLIDAISPSDISDWWYFSDVDYEGEPRTNGLLDIGCDEFWASGLTGELQVAVSVDHQTVAPGFAVTFSGRVDGRPSLTYWDFGDGSGLTNVASPSHSYSSPGLYGIVFAAENSSSIASATTTVLVVSGGDRYVATNGNDELPGTNWVTAKCTLQAGVDAAVVGGTVWVSNGVYNTGGRFAGGVANRVAVERPLNICGVNGPSNTVIMGAADESDSSGCGDTAVRGVYLTDQTRLAGFTITDGHTRKGYVNDGAGGGVLCGGAATVDSCLIVGNVSYWAGGGVFGGRLINTTIAGNQADEGGGVCKTILDRCYVIGNSVSWSGGGISESEARNTLILGNVAEHNGGVGYNSVLTFCTVVSNQAAHSCGGVSGGTIVNSIITLNEAPEYPNYDGGRFDHACASPKPPGRGALDRIPAFRDPSNGDFRLSAESPCIDAGLQGAMLSGETDLDGKPRVQGFGVDMGCFEYEFPGPHIQVSSRISTVYEGCSTQLWVRLSQEIEGAVTVSVARVIGDSSISAIPEEVVFTGTSWSNAQQVTVMAAEDDDLASCPAEFSFSAIGWTGVTVIVESLDNELAQALNATNLIWTTGGSLLWFSQTNVTHDGCAAVECSSRMEGGQETWLETQVSGPGTIEYWWRKQSYQNDLNVYVDSEAVSFWWNDGEWAKETIAISSGVHRIRWVLRATGYYTEGPQSAWLDEVKWTPTIEDTNNNGVPDNWEWDKFGTLDWLTSVSDWDEDGFHDMDEFKAGTDPNDDASFLGLENVFPDNTQRVIIKWQSISGKTYSVERTTNLMFGDLGFSAVISNITGQAGHTTVTDETAGAKSPLFYRILLEP